MTRPAVDVRRQRQLHEDAVDVVARVEAPNDIEQVGFAGRRWHLDLERRHAGRGRLAPLVAHVDFAGWIFSDQDHGETRRQAVIALEASYGDTDIGAELGGDGLAVDDRCAAHGASSLSLRSGVGAETLLQSRTELFAVARNRDDFDPRCRA